MSNLSRLIVSSPFGNYLHWAGVTSMLSNLLNWRKIPPMREYLESNY
jgi:hypothetical protein